MITINLVPVKERKKRKEIFIIFSIASVFMFIVLIMAYIYGQRLSAKSKLNKQIEEIKKESEGYQDKINEVKDLENKQASVDGFKKTIKDITETQRKILVAVDQTALSLPDGIWLTSFVQGPTKGANDFSIQGYSFSEGDIESYVLKLRKLTGFINEVVVDEKSVPTMVGKNKLHFFQINFKVMDPAK